MLVIRFVGAASTISSSYLIEKNTSIPFQEFKIAISIILNSTFFKFNDEFYEQIFGLPMGSPLSPILADLVIQDLERNIFNTLTTHIPFYYRYVDRDFYTNRPRLKFGLVE